MESRTDGAVSRVGHRDAPRDRYNAFIARHHIAWELSMGALAAIYVGVGFLTDDAPPSIQPALTVFEAALTVIFFLEFATRLAASRRRLNYLKAHAIDLVSLLPLARGLRVARLIRLLRLVRMFTSFQRVFRDIDRMADHRALGHARDRVDRHDVPELVRSSMSSRVAPIRTSTTGRTRSGGGSPR